MKKRFGFVTVITALLILSGSSYTGQTPGENKLNVVPETFLRAYDPITVFFPDSPGPAEGGPCDNPGDFLKITPVHPGEYRWVDGKTLQFLPTIAWPSLERFNILVRGRKYELITLMEPPLSTRPENNSLNLEPLQEITLGFKQQIGVEKLARVISFEIKDLPGISGSKAFRLTAKDFEIREIERQSLKDNFEYRIVFHKPISYGLHIAMNLRLSLDSRIPGSLETFFFSTRPVFRLTAVSSAGNHGYPISSSGSDYSLDQAIECGSGGAQLTLEFSDNPGAVSSNEIKRLVHFDPAVRNLRFSKSENKIHLNFDADAERAYKVKLIYVPLRNTSEKALLPFRDSSLYFYFRRPLPYLRWLTSQGIVETHGPQLIPLEGRGIKRVDLRIYKIAPYDRRFWPFPDTPVMVDENTAPDGPGEEPEDLPQSRKIRSNNRKSSENYSRTISRFIHSIGSPLTSRLVPLPMRNEDSKMRLGLDLKDQLARISGAGKPGAYLVGYRTIGENANRLYVRIQVTDLNLTTVEEESAVTFLVTSLHSGLPVSGATVLVEGEREKEWIPLIKGTTDLQGRFRYLHKSPFNRRIARISVRNGNDRLVLDPDKAPPVFLDNHWFPGYDTWLGWLNQDPQKSREETVPKGHILTERPVYRPEEPVHIKGYLRLRKQGRIIPYPAENKLSLIIRAPGNKIWTIPVALNEMGGFYHKFEEKDLPTGSYEASIRDEKESIRIAGVEFRKESYRIPTFEVKINGPDRIPLDQPFQLEMTANYYSGGPVIGQEVTWRTTQFLHRTHSPEFPGFVFSSDERFSGGIPFKSQGSSIKTGVTDETGAAVLTIDPSSEEDARPRRYIVEATVRGADEMTVTNTKSIIALPPFEIGLKSPSFVKAGETCKPQVLILGIDKKPLAGKEFHIEILQRQWHSYLQESDFTTGKAKYINDIVDKPILEKEMISEGSAKTIEFRPPEAGVYIVKVTARDQIGRMLKVTGDFYAAGETPVSWKKPTANVFETTPDKESYNPGDTARVILKSPFQQARALVVVEGPDENAYHWIDVSNGQGIFNLSIHGNMAPKIPIHILLQRGRLKGDEEKRLNGEEDRFKPVTVGNTTWLKVNPRDNELKIKLTHPEKCLPGAEININIGMTDPGGNPLNGEVALWLVDRAVLALGKEKRIDPLPSFMEEPRSFLRFHDTRNEVIGNLSIEEIPGGDGSSTESSIFDHVTVRRNFKSVPYFNPGIRLVDGRAEITIRMPDNLTEFAVRAVATDGRERFGSAKSMISVRLPLIIEPSLPRFVRPGDSFVAGGIGRVVEGEGGAGSGEIQVEGLLLKSNPSQSVNWLKNRAQPVYFPLTVPADAENLSSATVRMAVQRQIDSARDAFELKIPIRPDNRRRRLNQFVILEKNKEVSFPEPTEPARPNTMTQKAVITHEHMLLKMLSGLDFLANYEYGCTEQRISRLLPELALKDAFTRVGMPSRGKASDHFLRETFDFLDRTLTPSGLYGCWPGSRGYVSLTAYVVEFLVQAKNQGYSFKKELLEKPVRALKEALRSDYTNFITGHAFTERAEALAALASTGQYDSTYSFEFLSRAIQMDLYSEAKILHVFLENDPDYLQGIQRLSDDLWKSLIFKLRDGKETYLGLQHRSQSWGGLILASEIKEMSMVARALYKKDQKNPRLQLLFSELIRRGEGDGWGSTNANAGALLALGELLKQSSSQFHNEEIEYRFSGESKTLDTAKKAVNTIQSRSGTPGSLKLKSGEGQPMAWMTVEYVPSETGDRAKQKSEGFVVERELLIIQEKSQPPIRKPAAAGQTIELETGSVVEEHIRVVNAEKRNYVAIQVPFAAGFEPLNPNLATAPPEAAPAGKTTLEPSYAQYDDDRVVFFYDTLPKGTYDFYFRTKAAFEGQFSHPPARAEMMYDLKRWGQSDGVKISIRPRIKE